MGRHQLCCDRASLPTKANYRHNESGLAHAQKKVEVTVKGHGAVPKRSSRWLSSSKYAEMLFSAASDTVDPLRVGS